MKRVLAALIALGCFQAGLAQPRPAVEAMAAQLRTKTSEAFSRYVALTEARIDRQQPRDDTFLYVDTCPEPRRSEVLASLKRGEVFMERIETRDASGGEIDVPNGLIHHWIGAVFVPGATVRQALDVVEDYNHHAEIYQPEVVRSRVLSHSGDDYTVYFRFRKHKVITVTLDTDHDAHYARFDDTHWSSRSRMTRVQEVVNPGQPDEQLKPVGRDSGFLWQMSSYWRFVERDGGVYLESESISLTRQIPFGLSWLIGPFVTSVPKESLEHMLSSTRTAMLARASAARKH